MIQNIISSMSSDLFISISLGLIGGLGIFLYGIHIMGNSLKALAGDKMTKIIEKLTNNVFMGILIGIIVTAILQSSSGTTALSISLIRAGLMTAPQAIGIIMGANIGTTVTAFLFSFPKITDLSLLFIGLGAFLIFFFRNKKFNAIGQAVLGFGFLFYGMELMGEGLGGLAESEQVRDFIHKFSNNPLLAALSGAGVTALVQSSSATTGIVQSLYESGMVSLKGALPILFGNNIGTTITAVLAALGGSIAAKRASAFHVFFNFFGAILFLILLGPFFGLINNIREASGASHRLTIAYAHLIFNVINTLLIVGFISQIDWLIKKIIPGKDFIDEFNEDVFNEKMISHSPVLALESSKQAINHMGRVVKQMLLSTIKYSKTANPKVLEEANQLETIINTLDRKTHDYLVKTTAYVDETHSKTLSKYLDTIRDLERIGDHCENILEISEYIHDNKGYISQDAWKDLDKMYDTITIMVDSSLNIIDTNDKIIASQIIEIEKSVDKLEKKARKRHTIRVNDGVCTSETGINFIEILSNLERIGDHCYNIAEYTINEEYYVIIDEEEASLENINDVKVNYYSDKK